MDDGCRLRVFAVDAADVRVVRRLWEILDGAMPRVWSTDALAGDLRHGASAYWAIAEPGGEPIAFGGYWLIGDEAHLVMLAVDRVWQGRRVGSALLVHLLKKAGVAARRMTLEVRESNRPALALYRKFGFEALGRRPRYYGDEAALILWTPRIDTPAYRHRLAALESTLGWQLEETPVAQS
jgi:ribosomal-protein-alanine N-acetyltransferase